ncbi:hypothetical protein [Flavobacterium capsici]|uniref:Uncharacterized protein n=1 Tax=Flavobacterium capsici TaxID=3075618 RepID=A0AA96F157_9FLAO|nr:MULTISPECIES: hypothetical protein [unclassified Flavobacterium]WNM18188.1 hypothetical protein RN608_09195 [Flavobacterium sp. PMR2A8]WNM22239.1 hypothetical protein RN605_02495 [Flavobacterium sp. PMTSA4]
MRLFLVLLIPIVFFSSCKKQPETKIIDPNEISIHEIVHDTLTAKQIEDITKIHSTFAEVDTTSLENTLNDFKRDLNPDDEIQIWLQMANAYQSYMKGKNKTLEQKKEVYKLILSRSMMSSEEVIQNLDLKILSKKEAEEVLSFYTDNPMPIRVIEE